MEPIKEQIIDKYIEYVSQHGKRPFSIASFAESAGIEEAEFRKHFTSFGNLEKEFWSQLFEMTVRQLYDEELYASYSIREKMLALYYTWLEYLKTYRKYTEYVFSRERIWQMWPSEFESLKKDFAAFIKEIIREGKISGEIADRMVITDYYHHAIWMQFVFVHKFWVRDKSEGSENTDAAIEKAVNFGMDLMERNPIDSFFDLSRFVVQKW
jgi:AcrR family transcriptional regulator